jgi:hypothetical protein
MTFPPTHTPAKCIFPWKSVFAIIGDSGLGATWPLDTPTEVLTKMESAPEKPAPKSGPPAAKRALPSGWKVLEGGKKDATPLTEVRAKRPRAPKPSTPTANPPKRGYRKPGPFPPPAS